MARNTATSVSSGTRRGYSGQSRLYGPNRTYGRGRMPYRGSSYGRRRYGSNQYTGAILARLHSAHSALARADHDYKGHRVQAMHAVRSAIRQLSYSSSRRSGSLALNGALFRRTGNRNNLAGPAGRRGGLSQAQSDALMRRAQQTLRLVGSHMGSQGGSPRLARASGYVSRAVQHINVALTIR